MENESSNAGLQTWTEGGPIESMSPDEARAEIKAIENDPSFFGEGKAYWPRQQMLRRRIAPVAATATVMPIAAPATSRATSSSSTTCA